MNYPATLRVRLTRDGELVTINRYLFSGYYEVTKGLNCKTIFDTGREAWAYYRHNRSN